MNKQTGKKSRRVHGSPRPTASPTPKTHDRWAGPTRRSKRVFGPRWGCELPVGCGERFEGFGEYDAHRCAWKVGGV